MSKSSATYGHIKRRLRRGEPLTGNLLQVALDAVGDGIRPPDDTLFDGLASKFKAGTPLDDYERHIMLDVVLLHARLLDNHAEAELRRTASG